MKTLVHSLQSLALVAGLLFAGTFLGRAAEPPIVVSDVTLLGDMECFRIKTPAATCLKVLNK